MNTAGKHLMALAVTTFLAASGTVNAVSDTFTYQGSLEQNGAVVDGERDFRFTVKQGNANVCTPMEKDDVNIDRGVFAVELSCAVVGDDYTMTIEVRDATSSNPADYVALTPDVNLRPTPQAQIAGFAEQAAVAANNSVTSTSITDGSITSNDLDATFLSSLQSSNGWGLDGNAVTADKFIGTTNNQSLVLKVADEQVGKISPNQTSSGNTASIVFGHPDNVASGMGATVSGGGVGVFGQNTCPNCVNSATNRFATVAGGARNSATGRVSTVSGGWANEASKEHATVSGGIANRARGKDSVVGGGRNNNARNIGATIAGGKENWVMAEYGSIIGGLNNLVYGTHGSVVGGQQNCAGGNHSFAAGRYAIVRASVSATFPCKDKAFAPLPSSGDSDGDKGSFVWADSQPNELITNGDDQFLIRSQGGVFFNISPETLSSSQHADFVIGDSADSDANVSLLLRNGVTKSARFIVMDDGLSIGSEHVGIGALPDNNYALKVGGEAFKTSGSGSWATSSDVRVKEQIKNIDDALGTLLQVRPVTYVYNDDYRSRFNLPEKRQHSVIAQEFAQVFPEAVQGSGEYLPGYEYCKQVSDEVKQTEPCLSQEILSVDTYPAQITAIAAIQELAVKLDAAEEENVELKKQLQALSDRLDALENK